MCFSGQTTIDGKKIESPCKLKALKEDGIFMVKCTVCGWTNFAPSEEEKQQADKEYQPKFKY